MSDSLLITLRGERGTLTLINNVLVLSKLSAPVPRPFEGTLDNVVFVTLTPISPVESVLRIFMIYVEENFGLGDVSSKEMTVTTSEFYASSLSSSLAHLLLPIPAPIGRTVSLLINPNAGSGLAHTLYKSIVCPLCYMLDVKIRIIERLEEGTKLEGTLMVMGGDGTVHEVVNKLLGSGSMEGRKPVDLIIMPLGTANALYYSLFPPESPSTPSDAPKAPFYSFLSYLLSRPASRQPLSLAHTSIRSPDHPPKSTITSVVTSFALHAAILHDSEKLRATVPGIERFKIAAHQNGNKRWNGLLTLTGPVSLYSPTTHTFISIPEDERRTLEGPFAYIASTLVSRFESKFIIAPLRSPLSPLPPSPSSPSLDLIIIRPPPSLSSEDPQEFTPEVWRAMGGAYSQGSHIHFSGSDGTGSLVEYYRVGGFEWVPSGGGGEDMVCMDGVVELIGEGETVVTEAVGGEGGVSVWC